MQQTENYKLNLIETSDPFSPDALNENAETLAAELARMDAALDAIPRIYFGTYVGNGTANRLIELPFTPKLVFVTNSSGQIFLFNGINAFNVGGLALAEYPNGSNIVKTAEDGFWVTHINGFNTTNSASSTYLYFAFG